MNNNETCNTMRAFMRPSKACVHAAQPWLSTERAELANSLEQVLAAADAVLRRLLLGLVDCATAPTGIGQPERRWQSSVLCLGMQSHARAMLTQDCMFKHGQLKEQNKQHYQTIRFHPTYNL